MASGGSGQGGRVGQPFIILGLVVAVNIGVVFAGIGMLRGSFEGPNYLAIITGLFGLIGGGALGMAVPGRAPKRSTDPPSLPPAVPPTP